MGIPGVQRQALELSEPHNRKYFAGGDLYLDAMNFAQLVSSRSDATGTQDRARSNRRASRFHEMPLKRACRQIDEQIRKLEDLQPHSVTAVFDSMISEEKFKVRLTRAEQKLRKSEASMPVSGVLAERIQQHPKFNLIYSGTEAEDEIMKLIDEDKGRDGRRQFVFSSDSDVFRFHIHGSDMVEVVPLVGQKFHKSTIRTINLEKAQTSRIVPASKRIYPPIERLGISTVNPRCASRKLFEFLNCGNIHHRFFISLGPVVIPGYTKKPLDMDPYEAGVDIRRTAYGYIMATFFTDRSEVDTSNVEEWRQQGFKMVPLNVEPLRGNALNDALKLTYSYSLPQLVQKQLESVASKYKITRKEIENTVALVQDLDAGHLRRPTHAVSDRTHRLFILLTCIIKSLTFLNEALDIRVENEALDMQLSVHDLQSYLNAPRNSLHLRPSGQAYTQRQSTPRSSQNAQFSNETSNKQQEPVTLRSAVTPAAKPSSERKTAQGPPTAYLASLQITQKYTAPYSR